ncbi:MAG: hypothetical protein OXI80_08450, partial [Caldilineaceae bacterium]|nr:hypothetical protein [Caldilineaceae bacterium]
RDMMKPGLTMAAQYRAESSIRDMMKPGLAMAAQCRAESSIRDMMKPGLTMAAQYRAESSIRDMVKPGLAMAAQCRVESSIRDMVKPGLTMAAQFGTAPAISDMVENGALSSLIERVPVSPHYPSPRVEEGVWAEYDVPADREERSLEFRLRKIDPGLGDMLLGARQALNTPNPDRSRHVLISLRELVTHVLRLLAPDGSIQIWNSDPDYYHNGRPTRRARLLYINREINTGSLSKSVDAHVHLALILMDELNAESHIISSRLTEQELRALVIDTESLLYSILGKFLLNQSTKTTPM